MTFPAAVAGTTSTCPFCAHTFCGFLKSFAYHLKTSVRKFLIRPGESCAPLQGMGFALVMTEVSPGLRVAIVALANYCRMPSRPGFRTVVLDSSKARRRFWGFRPCLGIASKGNTSGPWRLLNRGDCSGGKPGCGLENRAAQITRTGPEPKTRSWPRVGSVPGRHRRLEDESTASRGVRLLRAGRDLHRPTGFLPVSRGKRNRPGPTKPGAVAGEAAARLPLLPRRRRHGDDRLLSQPNWLSKNKTGDVCHDKAWPWRHRSCRIDSMAQRAGPLSDLVEGARGIQANRSPAEFQCRG